MHRAGLFNFWYYDNEEYFFADGKLLLRGSNGSGKSVTMQSLITVLLDGKIAASRLDPFGSKDRRMEDYLLGEKEIVQRDERTGYLYLEYKRANSDQYITTGIGMKAKRGSNLDFWGFIILDNRRLGHELQLYKTEFSAFDGSEERIPLSRPELEKAIGQGGFVVRTQHEYMALVNKHVFGFLSIDSYKDLMELLLKLRSPKLSKDFKPSIIHEILTESLPALSDDELRPLSDIIENMDETLQQIEKLEGEERALQRLNRQYDQYNKFVLREKADAVVKANKKQIQIAQSYEEQLQDRENKRVNLESVIEQCAAYEREFIVQQQEAKELQDHDVFKAEKQKVDIEVALSSLRLNCDNKEKMLQDKLTKEKQATNILRSEQEVLDQGETKIIEILDELLCVAEEAAYDNHVLAAKDFERSYGRGYTFAHWKREVSAYQQKIGTILKKIREQAETRRQQDQISKEVDEAQENYDKIRESVRKSEQLFFDEREELLAKVYQWIKTHEMTLPLKNEEIKEVSQALQRLFEGSLWHDVTRGVDEAHKRQDEKWRRELVELEHQIQQKENEKIELNKTLGEWKNKKDPEPKRHPETVAARLALEEKKIPFVPLYEAVEFHKNVSLAERERIEGVLNDIGLLDALVVPQKVSQKLAGSVFDKVIRPDPVILAATLADYLYPTPPAEGGISAGEIDEVLRSILIDEDRTAGFSGDGGSTVLSVQYGVYRSGLIHGLATMREAAVYIGREARNQYRLQEIARLEAAIGELTYEKNILEQERLSVLQALRVLQDSRADFPVVESLALIHNQWQMMIQEASVREADVERKNANLRKGLVALQALQTELKELTMHMSLPSNEETYEKALSALQEYVSQLHELELAHQGYLGSQKNVERTCAQLTELQEDIDGLKGECHILTDDIASKRLVLEKIIERLELMGAEEISRRCQQVANRIQELPGLIREATTGIATLKATIEQLDERLIALAEERAFIQDIWQRWQLVFTQEIELRLVYGSDEVLPEAEEVLTTHKGMEELHREKANSRLSESFYRENTALLEYRMVLDELFADDVQIPEMGDETKEKFLWQLEQLQEKTPRQRILLEYDGRRVSPTAALVMMNKHITEQRSILSERDRELYEEVIMNSIGRIISKRIHSAEKWAEQMNELMGKLDTSSGLTFSLRWKALHADGDEEMDTQELVDLLRADQRLLKEEDLKRVVRHFQLRIEQARTTAAGKMVNFQQAVKEVLDFRRWFAFSLYYCQERIGKKELTNNAFGKFSGGEKAMAMYVPLFSAAFSRYREAKSDAPHIISLDEAFAGVDENNIREMFDLLEKLGFNYIMNSQALWGDYDTVAKLAIYELVRPKNAPYVTVVRYLWDGQTRYMLDHEVE